MAWRRSLAPQAVRTTHRTRQPCTPVARVVCVLFQHHVRERRAAYFSKGKAEAAQKQSPRHLVVNRALGSAANEELKQVEF